jgi:hypothetical protein
MTVSSVCLSDNPPFITMAGDCRYPAISAEGNTIVMAWLVTEIRPASVYFRRSTNEGRAWSSARKISNENGDCQPPSVAVDSGVVHLVWVDCGEVIDGELQYTRSLDGGTTWEKNSILIGNINSAQYPLVSCGGSSVYLIWQDVGTNIFFKVSRDRGQTWEKEMLLGAVGKQSCYCFPPALSANGNELTVVWTNFRETRKNFPSAAGRGKRISSVICRKSSDNGRTWSKEHVLTSTRIPREMNDEIDNPTLFSDGSRSYLFWQDKHDRPLGEILYTRFDGTIKKRSITGKPLCPTPKRAPKCPSVVFDNDRNLHFTWATFFGGESIVHYSAIDPAGAIVHEKKDLTSSTGTYRNPTIARTASGLLHIVWFNKPNDKSETAGIFLSTSRDNGATWEHRGPEPDSGTVGK